MHSDHPACSNSVRKSQDGGDNNTKTSLHQVSHEEKLI
jgi:hypothetical protein